MNTNAGFALMSAYGACGYVVLWALEHRIPADVFWIAFGAGVAMRVLWTAVRRTVGGPER